MVRVKVGSGLMYYIYQSLDKDGNTRSCVFVVADFRHFSVLISSLVTQWESYSNNHMLIIKMIDAGKV